MIYSDFEDITYSWFLVIGTNYTRYFFHLVEYISNAL